MFKLWPCSRVWQHFYWMVWTGGALVVSLMKDLNWWQCSDVLINISVGCNDMWGWPQVSWHRPIRRLQPIGGWLMTQRVAGGNICYVLISSVTVIVTGLVTTRWLFSALNNVQEEHVMSPTHHSCSFISRLFPRILQSSRQFKITLLAYNPTSACPQRHKLDLAFNNVKPKDRYFVLD